MKTSKSNLGSEGGGDGSLIISAVSGVSKKIFDGGKGFFSSFIQGVPVNSYFIHQTTFGYKYADILVDPCVLVVRSNLCIVTKTFSQVRKGTCNSAKTVRTKQQKIGKVVKGPPYTIY